MRQLELEISNQQLGGKLVSSLYFLTSQDYRKELA